ncbi:MAG TPA: hypothetical protein VI457_10735, partial [Methylococcaceae bacterium]|nr:hypothetical protein [Methylococcaceae bacterium]
EQRARIFERYHSGWRDGNGEHIGMGLYSARVFTRLHRGDLCVEDGEEGHGATLVLRLPADPFDEEPGNATETGRAANPDAGCGLAHEPAGLAFQAVWLAGSPKMLPLSFNQPHKTACRQRKTS